MPLPEGFNPFEQLQDTWRRVHNRRVKEHFRDLADPDDDWNPTIETPRGGLRVACTMSDGDSGDMTIIRTLLFWVVLGEASSLHPPLYTTPTDHYQQIVRFLPQVKLYFKEDLEDVEEGYAPIDAEISFRLKNETSETLTDANVRTIANKIRTEFAANNGYRWKKGRIKATYADLENGYHFIISSFSESEGLEVIRKVLDVQGHSVDEDKITYSKLAQNPPTVPHTQRILGKSRRLPRKRPVGYVRFIYAELHVWGLPNAICLLDRSGRRQNPLVSAR